MLGPEGPTGAVGDTGSVGPTGPTGATGVIAAVLPLTLTGGTLTFGLAYRAESSTYAVAAGDSFIDCTSGTFTVTMPGGATAFSGGGRLGSNNNGAPGRLGSGGGATANTASQPALTGGAGGDGFVEIELT